VDSEKFAVKRQITLYYYENKKINFSLREDKRMTEINPSSHFKVAISDRWANSAPLNSR